MPPIPAVSLVSEPTPAPRLSAEERLKIENLHLKVQNLLLQQQQMQADIQKSVEMRLGFQQEMADLQKELGDRYGVDMTKVRILPDGTILTQG